MFEFEWSSSKDDLPMQLDKDLLRPKIQIPLVDEGLRKNWAYVGQHLQGNLEQHVLLFGYLLFLHLDVLRVFPCHSSGFTNRILQNPIEFSEVLQGTGTSCCGIVFAIHSILIMKRIWRPLKLEWRKDRHVCSLLQCFGWRRTTPVLLWNWNNFSKNWKNLEKQAKNVARNLVSNN